MYIDKVDIHNFRAFQHPFSLHLGRYITAISGLNGIGKSTILAILANSSELKLKDGKLLNGAQFRGEFSNVIMYDPQHDSTGPKVKIYFKDLPNSEQSTYKSCVEFRAATQQATRVKNFYTKEKGSSLYKKHIKREKYIRYRLIPRKTNGWPNEKKVNWPSYYLGLSRLYPIGETDSAKKKKLSNNISKSIMKKHIDIMSEKLTNADWLDMQNLSIPNVRNSKFGLNTKSYSSTSNSSGQDDLGQILLVLKSFEILKESLGSNYHGGILTIDELDASLHPAAQNKLFDWLLIRSKQLNLQIVFTTHSLSLLEHISKKIGQKGNSLNDITISYLTTASDRPGYVSEKRNPKPNFYRFNLTQTYQIDSQFNQQVNIITEDDTARIFCKLILSSGQHEELQQLNFLNVKISWSHIMNFLNADRTMFDNEIIILDPDLNKDNMNKLQEYIKKQFIPIIPNDPRGNLFILPGEESIEKMMWNYLKSLPSSAKFYQDDFIQNNGIDFDKVKDIFKKYENDKNKYKHWFKDFSADNRTLMKYWIVDNKSAVESFINNIYQSFSRIRANMAQ